RPWAASLAVLAMAALVVGGVLAWSGLGSRRIAELQGQVETALDFESWDAADKDQAADKHLVHIEGLLEELKELSPDQAAAQRQRLHQRLAEWVKRQIG